MIDAPSPNFNGRTGPVRFIVLHYTNMKTAQEALSRLRDPGSEVSGHYLIDESGEVFRLVEEDKRAWHAGKSFWRGERDLNSAAIGIELANPGHLNGYVPFPAPQIAALKELLREIMARHAIPASALLGHSDIAPRRKEDPGELFPWQALAAEGLGLWPQPKAEDFAPETAPNEAFSLLAQIGYDCPKPGDDEEGARAALHAFQRRFHPEALMDEITPETLARLRALARQWR